MEFVVGAVCFGSHESVLVVSIPTLGSFQNDCYVVEIELLAFKRCVGSASSMQPLQKRVYNMLKCVQRAVMYWCLCELGLTSSLGKNIGWRCL